MLIARLHRAPALLGLAAVLLAAAVFAPISLHRNLLGWIAIMEKIVAHDPNNTDSKRILGVFYMWRGQILGKSGNVDGALADHRLTALLLVGDSRCRTEGC